MTKFVRICFLLSLASFFSTCRKDVPIGDSSGGLSFDRTKITFDTVFSSVGSVTKRFKLYNSSSSPLTIASVSLGGGNTSYYRINIDGILGKKLTNIQIPAKDSLFGFVEVTLNPQSSDTPFLVEDSLIFVSSNNTQYIKLLAYGQNAHYIIADKYFGSIPFKVISHSNDTTWGEKDSLPIVVYGYAVVDSLQKLTIKAGAKIYFHPGSALWVYRGGSLDVQGELGKPVVFQGDRLQYEYRDVAGQWDRIWINDGGVNSIKYAVIKNALIGIQAEIFPLDLKTGKVDPQAPTKLTLDNTVIKNMNGLGILARNFNINCTNTVITDCAQALMWFMGGVYDFRHCTLADYYPFANRQNPAVLLSDTYESTGQHFNLDANFHNSIIYGDQQAEVGFTQKGSGSFAYMFNHCLMRVDSKTNTSDGTHYNACSFNIPFHSDSTIFVAPYKSNYELSSVSSFALGKGDPAIANTVPKDIKGRARTTNPDLGAYQKSN